jgi:hypothetical protein
LHHATASGEILRQSVHSKFLLQKLRDRTALCLGPSCTRMLGSLPMSRIFRAGFCTLLAACILLGPALGPSYVLCVEAPGFVDVEPVNASCCGKDFDRNKGSGLIHACGSCSDTALRVGLHRPNYHSLCRALPTALFLLPISAPPAFDVPSRRSQPPLQKARPPGIVLLC